VWTSFTPGGVSISGSAICDVLVANSYRGGRFQPRHLQSIMPLHQRWSPPPGKNRALELIRSKMILIRFRNTSEYNAERDLYLGRDLSGKQAS
jgi:hypothetical protein